MRRSLSCLVLGLSAPAQFSQAQLVIPTSLPSTASNFKLRAHAATGNTTLAGNIQNWVVATSGESSCNQIGNLVGDDAAGQTFFVNIESGTIQSEQDGRRRILTLEENRSNEKVLKLECGEEALSELGISFPHSDPVLALMRDNDSQFYACQDEMGTVAVFYRAAQMEPLRPECTDIKLLLECTAEPDHGEVELAVCCVRVEDGNCLSK